MGRGSLSGSGQENMADLSTKVIQYYEYYKDSYTVKTVYFIAIILSPFFRVLFLYIPLFNPFSAVIFIKMNDVNARKQTQGMIGHLLTKHT